MNKLFILLILFGFKLYSQEIPNGFFENYNYSAFNGIKYSTYSIETESTVILIEKSLINSDYNNLGTLEKMFSQIENYYKGYIDFFGFEPFGGLQDFNNKASVFFGPASCGAACGRFGSKGIEVSPFLFNKIYNEIKYGTNMFNLSVIGYEFGRNFFTQADKLLFPYNPDLNQRNGGFAEAFANLPYLNIYLNKIKPLLSSDRIIFQETDKYYRELNNLFLAYINDLNTNPENSLLYEKTIFDINRNKLGFNIPSYIATAIIISTFSNFEMKDFKVFYESIKTRSPSDSIEKAMGAIAFGFSKSLNLNLINYFENVLKFKLDDDSKSVIKNLPSIQNNRLIKDLKYLYFTTHNDSINLNIRSIDYNPIDSIYSYKVYLNDSLFSSNFDGNNTFFLKDLNNRDSVEANILLVKKNVIIDSFSTTLLKRKIINASDFVNEISLYSYKNLGKATISNNIFSIKNVTQKNDTILWDKNILELSYPVRDNRKLRIKADVLNNSLLINDKNNPFPFEHSLVSLRGRWGSAGTQRVGTDIGINDSITFYSLETVFDTNIFFRSDESKRQDFLELKLSLEALNSNASFKNITIEDITDSDQDGIIDFEDFCPNSPLGSTVDVNGCEIFTISSNNFNVSVTSLTCIGSQNGSIGISALDQQYSYTASISGQSPVVLNSSNNFASSISGLEAGNYDICFTVSGIDSYNQCFSVTISEPAPLSASAKVDLGNRSVDLSLKGSERYTILLNGEVIQTSNTNVSLDLKPGMNYLSISTNLDCQGTYFEEIFVSEEVLAYPNPTDGIVQLYVGGTDNNVTLNIYNISSQNILSTPYEVSSSRVIEADISRFKAGIYFFVLDGKTIKTTHKIIKK